MTVEHRLCLSGHISMFHRLDSSKVSTLDFNKPYKAMDDVEQSIPPPACQTASVESKE